MNHPNRHPGHPAANPTSDDVRALRGSLTQAEAARRCMVSLECWQQWEAPKSQTKNRRVHPLMWWAMRDILGDVPPKDAKIPDLEMVNEILKLNMK